MGAELIGRDRELARLEATLTAGSAAVSVITGSAGVGKSHLLHEAVTSAAQNRRVELAVATEAAASIPFGALAHLVPIPQGPQTEQLPYLQRALEHLTDVFEEGRGILAIDDAHLLDVASATLVHQLARTRAMNLVLTRRAGEASSDAISEVVKDADIHLRLAPLDRAATRRIVETHLGGRASERLHAAAWHVTQGNPLYLRELLLDAREDGRIAGDQGLWDLQGGLIPGQRLREVVAARLRRLDDQERAACEILAMAEPLEVDIALEHVDAAAVERLIRRGFVVITSLGHRRVASLSHPVYRETLRLEVPEPRTQRIWGWLATSLASRGARRSGDLLRLAAWQMNAARAADTAQLTEAARLAFAAFDYELAERLSRTAAEEGAFEPRLVLAEALSHQLRLEEAERAFADAKGVARGRDERLRLAIAESEHLFFRAGRPDQATAVLRDLLRNEELQAENEDRVRASLAVFAAVRGDLPAASEAGRRILRRQEPAPDVLVATLFVSTLADAMLGRSRRAHEGVQVGLRHTDAVRTELPLAEDILHVNDIAAYAWAGELHRAEALASAGRKQAFDAEALDAVGPWTWLLIEVLLLRGRIEEARALATETLPVLSSRDPLRIRPSLVAVCGAIWSMAGDAPPPELVEEHGASPLRGDARVITLAARSAAWRLAIHQDLAEAADEALRAGVVAEERTQLAWAALSYHDAIRFGHSQGAIAPLTRLARSMEGELFPALVAHARAVDDGDAEALEGASRRFETFGADLYAAEASAQAARLFLRERPDRARRASSRARSIAARCPGAATPALRGLGGEELTPRELQVATLAAEGLPSQEIADRLTISRRTVDNYLGSAYRKLGISSRDELSFTLGTASS